MVVAVPVDPCRQSLLGVQILIQKEEVVPAVAKEAAAPRVRKVRKEAVVLAVQKEVLVVEELLVKDQIHLDEVVERAMVELAVVSRVRKEAKEVLEAEELPERAMVELRQRVADVLPQKAVTVEPGPARVTKEELIPPI